MEQILSIVKWCVANYQSVITTAVAVMSALISACLLIPGEQPEKFLQSVVDFLSKFSKKPSIK